MVGTAGEAVELALDVPARLPAPIRASQVVGTAHIKSGGVSIAQCDVVAAASVERRDLIQGLKRLIRLWVIHLSR